MNYNLIKRLQADIKMPTHLAVGDDFYIEDYENHPNLVYVKDFSSDLNWVGHISLEEVDCGDDYRQIILNVGYSDNRNDAILRCNGTYYESEDLTETLIGLDTATMYLGVDDGGFSFTVGSDGLMGAIYEYKKDNQLVGLYIDLVLDDGCLKDIDSIKDIIDYLFKCNLS